MVQKHMQSEERKQRDDLAGEYKFGDAGQIVLACLFAAAWISDTFLLKQTIFLNHYVPLGIRMPLGVIVLVLSGYMATTGLFIVFGEKRETPGVITKSVFGVVRHPVYLSEILLYLGLLILSISLVAAAVWVIGVGFLYYISRYEERLLLARFGEDYEKYMREVPMWIPRLRKR